MPDQVADIQSVGIISKPNVPRARSIVPGLVDWLAQRNISIRADEETAHYAQLREWVPRERVPVDTQLVIVLGGDGTLLSAARAIGGMDIPLLAVNLGGLGFLTSVTVEELYPELERTLQGEQRIGMRRMLRVEIHRGGSRVSSYEALNDAVITKTSLARMIDVAVHVDSHFVSSYKADGLIVSTPTGSTAYSLSAGGPIIFPQVDAISVTPICPHMLTHRPVIVPGDSVIRLENRAMDRDAYLTIDGQVGEPLLAGDEVLCERSPFAIRLIRPPKMLFFDVLREKLKWGER
ncbi:NAD(+)/NADH kinase [Bryobacter aggregatus]|uniref:NAD(+)/NADH kinase n=1 Tax=Bryobacter aggregatus TaxID=360054 RepID=UPI00068D78EF|nr:NAD(+)/NADH kinase [Bryobacter aggregatus]